MKWLPHDLTTWAFFLSVAALVLAVPFGIVGTLLAPKVQVWWATRSLKSVAQRLILVSQYHAKIQKEPLFSGTETIIVRQNINLMVAIHLVGYLVMIAVSFAALPDDIGFWEMNWKT